MLYKNRLSRVLSLTVSVIFLVAPLSVGAQQCDVVPEMVTKLFYPDRGTYTVWDADYGEGGRQEVFKDSFEQGDGVLAVGEMVRMEGVGPSLMFVRFDRRGKIVWEKYHSISGLFEVVGSEAYGAENAQGERGFVVLANIRKGKERRSSWVGFFNADGKMVSQKHIRDERFDLSASDINLSVAGDGWVVPVASSYEIGSGESKTIRQNAVIYTLDHEGKDVSSRAYVLGNRNYISSLYVSNSDEGVGGYIATGWFENDFGKRQGWLMYLDNDLSMVWQKEFSRGKSANLQKSIIGKNGQIVTVGGVFPVNGGGEATWIMRLDEVEGKMIWQRYYYGETGAHDYSPLGVFENDDGLITLAMGAVFNPDRADDMVKEEDENALGDEFPIDLNFTQFLTLNPRGVTLSGDSYVYGKGVDAFGFSSFRDGRFLLAGRTIVPQENAYKMNDKNDLDANEPLLEPSFVGLPDVDMSDKAKAGLAKLRQNIHAQDVDAKAGAGLDNDSAKSIPLTYNAWVAIADAPNAYEDPCLH
ncbi:MAG: hypothetical protein ACRBDI_09990 [Alphaproteobacteria bacterium]